LHGLSPNYHIYASVSDLYIPTIDLPILQQENMWTDPWNILYKLLAGRYVNVEIGTEAAQFLFLELEYINGIFVAVSGYCEILKSVSSARKLFISLMMYRRIYSNTT
jgi:hypothetical protein